MPETLTNFLSIVKTDDRALRQIFCTSTLPTMDTSSRPFGAIAERILWHRTLTGLTQEEYARRISTKRATLNNWESGDYRRKPAGVCAFDQGIQAGIVTSRHSGFAPG